MNLGVFLAIGESLKDLRQKGQLSRLIDYNIKSYAKNFDKVYIFSYANESAKLPKKCFLVANKNNIHRYSYSLLMPLLNYKQIKDCDVLRGLQLTGGIPAAVAKILFGKNFVFNYGYDYESFAKIEGKPIQSFFYKIIKVPILSLATSVIATSTEIKNTLGKLTSNKISYIPNGVDLKLFSKVNNYHSRKDLKLIYIGRLEKQKNLENLIRAIKLVKTNTHLTFYGQGLQKVKLEKLAKKLRVNLKIRPPVEYQKVPQVLSSADIFVLPSQEEGNPKILLEAMATGIATIGTNVVGIRELVTSGHNAMLTQTDPASIARAIEKLKDARIRQKLGEAARKFIEAKFDLEKLLKEETNLLKTAVQK